jgi:hypothetical protein
LISVRSEVQILPGPPVISDQKTVIRTAEFGGEGRRVDRAGCRF